MMKQSTYVLVALGLFSTGCTEPNKSGSKMSSSPEPSTQSDFLSVFQCRVPAHDFIGKDYVTLAIQRGEKKEADWTRGILIYAAKYDGVEAIFEVRVKVFPSSELKLNYVDGSDAISGFIVGASNSDKLSINSPNGKSVYAYSMSGCKFYTDTIQLLKSN